MLMRIFCSLSANFTVIRLIPSFLAKEITFFGNFVLVFGDLKKQLAETFAEVGQLPKRRINLSVEFTQRIKFLLLVRIKRC